MAETRAVHDELAAVAGRAAMVGETARFAVRGVQPRSVVAPDSADAAAAVLALCSAEGWTVECAGGGTWLRHGRTPAAVDVVLTTSRITGTIEYEPADLTIGLRAGTSLDEARELCGAHRQELPLDGPAHDGATVGAMFATATAGPLRTAHGAPRDQALGIEVVTGDGRVLRFGGRVVKNVAGYDLVRLLVGSHGTLGLITGVHLRLRGRPERDVTLVAQRPDRAALIEAAQTAVTVEPAALELQCGAAAGNGDSEGWRLIARLRGNAEAVDDATRRLREIAPAFAPIEPLEAQAAWQEAARIEADASVTLRARTLPFTLGATVEVMLAMAGGTLPPGWSLCAHAGEGTVRLLGPASAEPWDGPSLERFAADVAAARSTLSEGGGTLVVPVPPPDAEGVLDPYAADEALVPLMRRLKAAFDPDGIMAPGRFVL